MADLTFKANLLPNTDLGKALGSSTQRWNIYGNLTGNADTATELSNTPNNTTTFLRGDNTWSNNLSGSMVIGAADVDAQRALSISSSAGNLTLFSNGNTDGRKGVWVSPHGTDTTGHSIIISDTNNATTFYGNLSGNATHDGNGNVIANTYVKKAGDTMTGPLYINNTTDVGLNQNGPLIIGTKSGNNIAIDNDEIMARNNSAASPLYLNWEGGLVNVGAGGLTAKNNITANGGYLKSTLNNNTVTIGSQNTQWCHFTNSADVPFYFNKRIHAVSGFTIYNTLNSFNSGSIELSGGTPYIDFHYNNTTTDYDVRLINQASGALYCTGNLWAQGAGERYFRAVNTNTGVHILLDSDSTNHGIWSNGYWNGSAFTSSGAWIIYRGTDSYAHSGLRLYGAVWNDYAEYRQTKENIEPGRCIVETGKGDLVLSTKRLQEGCEIVSDTFGFAIGKSEKNKTPTAASGRVLAYLYENKELAKPGRPVCSGPNGTVSLMTNEEAREYPWCIIGTVSEIPDYETWRAGDLDSDTEEEIQVNGRIWIRIR